MIFPWNRVFEHFRDRGRGALFFGGLATVLGVMIGVAILVSMVGESGAEMALACLAVLFGMIWLVQICLWIKRARTRRLNRYKISPLSRDEICKARSKLVRKR